MRSNLAAFAWIVLSIGSTVAVAGDMKATLKAGVLTVTDSSADDSFTIDQAGLGSTSFRLTPDPGTTINGSAVAQLFSNVTADVRLKFTEGSDTADLDDLVIARDLAVTSTGGTLVTVAVINGLDVGRDLRVDSKSGQFTLSSTGAGSIVRRDVKCTLRGLNGNSLIFTPLTVLRNTTVKGSNATDVFVVGANVHLVGNVTIDFGLGIDTYVDALTTVVGGDFKFKGKGGSKTCVLGGKLSGDVVTDVGNGDGNTIVITAPQIGGSVRAKYGQGTNNVLTVSGPVITGDLECTTKGNADFVTIANITTGGDVRIKLANGANTAILSSNGAIGGDVWLTGGTGADQFNVNASTIHGDVRANLSSVPFGFVDSYSMLLATIGDDVVVKGGAGLQAGAIEDVTVLGEVRLDLGSGDNSYTIDGGTFGSIVATAGSGSDTFVLTGGTINTVADIRILLGSGNNTMPISKTTCGRDLIVTTGNGDDSISIATSTIVGELDIDLGGGMNAGP